MPDRLLRQLQGHQGAIHAIRFTEDGSYCMTASDDRTLKLWNPHKTDPNIVPQGTDSDSALCIQTFAGVHGYPIHDVSISSDKSRFASGGDDRSCYLWDVASSRVIRRIQAHQHHTNALCFNADASVLFTASYDQTVKCWDLRAQSKDPIQVLTDFKDSVTSLQLTTDCGKIVTSCIDGYIRVYDMRLGCMHADHVGEMMTSVRVSDDDKSYLVTCLGGKVKLIDLDSGKLLKEYRGHQHESFKTEAVFHYHAGRASSSPLANSSTSASAAAAAAAASTAGGVSSQQAKAKPQNDIKHQILCGSEDGSIFHWDLLTGQVVDSSHKVHRKAISSLACHPTQDLFVTASYDGTAKCWTSSSSSSSSSS